MANLKNDLDEYLLLQSDQKKNFKIDMKLPAIKVPKLFGSNSDEPANDWLRDETCCPKLSRIQRIIGFVVCILLGIFCMTVSTFYIPLLVLKARKFALLYTLGSVFFILAFGFLSGFGALLKQMFAKEKLLVSMCYFLSLICTLYFAVFQQSTAFTVLFAVVQIISLLWMIMASVPGGATGLKFFGQMFKSTVSNTLPV